MVVTNVPNRADAERVSAFLNRVVGLCRDYPTSVIQAEWGYSVLLPDKAEVQMPLGKHLGLGDLIMIAEAYLCGLEEGRKA